MDELLVEWTLVRNRPFVEQALRGSLSIKFNKIKLIHQQFSDDNGRIDLIYHTDNDEILLVELETGINSTSKYEFCMDQIKRYMNMGPIHFPEKICHSIILYAPSQTSEKLEEKLKNEAQVEGILLSTYDLEEVQQLYEEEVKRLSKTIGLSLKTPTSDMPYTLSAINRFLCAFIIKNKNILSTKDVQNALPTSKGKNKGLPWSYASVTAHKYLADGLGAISLIKQGRTTIFKLEKIGADLIKNMNMIGVPLNNISSLSSSIPLSTEQKRIILSELMKDNFKEVPTYKSMILLFMRFLMLTGGTWVPKQRDYSFDEGRMGFLNSILGTNFTNTTNMGNIVTWSRNYCEELGLIEVIKLKGGSSKATITSLGSRVFNVLETLQHIKREIVHIPQQVE